MILNSFVEIYQKLCLLCKILFSGEQFNALASLFGPPAMPVVTVSRCSGYSVSGVNVDAVVWWCLRVVGK